MSLPPSVSESEFLAAVTHVASVLSAKFRFGLNDPDDIKQQCAVYALEALPRYEPSRGGLEGFIYRHCSNRLLNQRRDELGLRSDSPCRVCFTHARGYGDGHPDGSTCPKFAEWWARRQARLNVATPCSIDRVASLEQERGTWADSTVESDAADKELLALIDEHMPLHLRADFLRMRANVKIPKLRRDRVLQAARDIIENPTQYDAPELSPPVDEPELDDMEDDPDDGDE